MIVLTCWKCGEVAYLQIGKTKVEEKQVLCKACGKKKVKIKTFEMPEPYLGFKRQ